MTARNARVPTPRHARFGALVLALAVGASCSSGGSGDGPGSVVTTPAAPPTVTTSPRQPIALEFPDADGDLRLGEPVTREFAGPPLTDVAVSPTSDRLAVNRGDELCFVWVSPTRTIDEDRCAPSPVAIGLASLVWAPDSSRVVLNDDSFRLGGDPDLIQFDLATEEFTVLTDDGVPSDESGGDVDFSPMFTTDGSLYFFRVGSDNELSTSLQRLEDDGTVTTTGVVLEGLPEPSSTRAVDGSIVTALFTGATAPEIVSVDVRTGLSRSIASDVVGLDLVDVAADRVLVRARPLGGAGFDLLLADLGTGNFTPVGLPLLDETALELTGSGLSPDGTQLVLIIADQHDAEAHILLIADIAEDGSVGALRRLATGPEFAPNDGDAAIKPAGFGEPGRVAWTDQSMIYTVGPNRIVTLPLS